MFITLFLAVFALAGLLLLVRPLLFPAAAILKGLFVLLLVLFLAAFFLPADKTPRPAPSESEEGDKVTVSLN